MEDIRTSQNIKEAIDLFFEKNADTLFSVCETSHPAFWCNTLDENLSTKDFIKKEYQKPRQELPKTYTLNGAIYIIKTNKLDSINFYSDKSYAYIMNKEHSIDIDDKFDFILAENYLNNTKF